MVIGFSVKEAREQLLNEGVVHTYRWHRRAFFVKEKGTVESTWANTKRGTKSIGDVDIEEIGQIPYNKLQPYHDLSGFDVYWQWEGKIMYMMPFPACPDGWLYKVTLKRSNGSETK